MLGKVLHRIKVLRRAIRIQNIRLQRWKEYLLLLANCNEKADKSKKTHKSISTLFN